MTKSQYLNLQDAALLSDKSAQTIRRLIKGNKVRYRKYRTPQGFTYLVEKNSLMNHFEIEEGKERPQNDEPELVEEFVPEDELDTDDEEEEEEEEEAPVVEQVYRQERPEPQTRPFNTANGASAPADDQTAAGFQTVMTQLVQQHREDKKRLFELLEIFQKRILVLEDQIKQLEAPKSKKRWFGLW